MKKFQPDTPVFIEIKSLSDSPHSGAEQPTPQQACHKRRVQNFAQLEGSPDATQDSRLRGGRPGRGSSPGRGSGKSPPSPPLRTDTPRGRLPEGPSGVGQPRPGGKLARRGERASARGRPSAAPSPTPRRKSHLPRRALEAPGGHGGDGGERGPAGRGEGCSAPRAPPAPSRQPHPRRRPARSQPLRLRQAAPGQWGQKLVRQPRRGASEPAGGGRGSARQSVRARRERLPARPAPSSKAPPPPPRLRPLLASPPAPGDRRRHPVGGFPCPGSGARRRPGPGEGEEKGEGRGVDGRQGRRLRGGELLGEENVRLGGALGGGGGARRT
ncbi:uncharacterized protein LOC111171597 [Delphinapterus leucas]|uniref:Uncharacterized protein LOC111171597 n=1 Tax=Delphinapterus leucas TaxID=9749 RepID=A0A7F8K8A9_DELLE|nr:uncharacterized protein LOC111171597 [Delphinapterus leucas]